MTRSLKSDKPTTIITSKNDKINHGVDKFNKPLLVPFDKINIQILQELLKNNNTKTSDISLKLKAPLSTIQRRRAALERSGFLQQKYEIDHKKFGLRCADLLVDVSKRDCEEIAKEILNQYVENVECSEIVKTVIKNDSSILASVFE